MTRPRILLAHDLGDGLGHIAVLGPIAEALHARGADVLLALSDPQLVLPTLDRLGLPYVQAPHWRSRAPRFAGQRVTSFADLICLHGFDLEPDLRARVEAWDTLIDLYRPDLIILDFAPILSLAAYGRVPFIRVGSGYTTPPAEGDRLPQIRDEPEWLPPELLLAVMAGIQLHRGAPVPPSLAAMLRGEATLVTQLPELDPYRESRGQPAVGPLLPLPPPVEGPPETAYFAYLAPDYAGTAMVLEALIQSGEAGSVFLRGADPAQIAEWRQRGLKVHDRPVPMAEMAGKAAAVIHHGGIGTSEHVLALGRPQLIVPRHIEQVMTASALGRLGIAGRMHSRADFTVAQVVQGLRFITGEQTMAAAQEAARALAALGHRGSLAMVVETAEKVLGRPIAA